MYRFRFFRAVDDPVACDRFKEGHRKILVDYGITNVTTNTEDWQNDPDVFVITAETECGEMVGGIRLDRTSSALKSLPIQSALNKLDPEIDGLVRSDSARGTAEVCGLWNAKKVFGKGVSPLLARAAVAYAAFIEIDTLYCLVAQYTLDLAKSIGFSVLEEIGNQGTFKYPNDRFVASALRIVDLEELKTAIPSERRRIFSIRRNPSQEFIELSQKKNVAVAYQNDVNIVLGKANEQ
ncbi:hypothetical protein [Halocola ammonii]